MQNEMCALCNVLVSSHWAEQGDSRRARTLRTRFLRRVIGHFGLSLDEWAGAVYVLSDRKGNTAVVDDIGSLWVTAQALARRPLDPLDPTLLEALSTSG
jgi:hypothetical protein